jgi:hypothetical protein
MGAKEPTPPRPLSISDMRLIFTLHPRDRSKLLVELASAGDGVLHRRALLPGSLGHRRLTLH